MSDRGADALTLAGWSAEDLFAGDGQGLGVFRFAGYTQVRDEHKEWSVILKVLPADEAAPLTAWSLSMREPLAYESGLLETLPDALRAPRCLRHARYGSRHHLWLEDLGRDDAAWSLSDYAHAARHLGRFNGAYLEERALPAADWLSRNWLRSWLAEGAAAIDELPRTAEQRRYSASPSTRWLTCGPISRSGTPGSLAAEALTTVPHAP